MEVVFKHLTHHSIRPQVEKVVNVLDSRAVFPKDSIKRIRASLHSAKELHKGNLDSPDSDYTQKTRNKGLLGPRFLQKIFII